MKGVFDMGTSNLYDYLVQTYKANGEPIFMEDLNSHFNKNIRVELKRLIDSGKLNRFQKGVYFLPYKNMIGLEGKINRDEYLKKKFLDNDTVQGYITGFDLVNRAGFTSQVPAVLEIRSNSATTEQRKVDVGKRPIIIYKPWVKITKENKKVLQFLDLMYYLSDYNEYYKSEDKEYFLKLIKRYIQDNNIDLTQADEYIGHYPDKLFKNLYTGGLYGLLA